MFTKVAIVLLYLRIFPSSVTTWFRTACYTIIGVCIACTIGVLPTVAFECSPISGAYLRWDGETETKCLNTTAQVVSMAAVNILLDLVVFILPIPKIIKLNISANKKVGICFTFLVGLFVTAVSAVRLEKLYNHADTTNPTWDLNPIAIWSQAEVNVGIVCACMPSFARLIKQFWNATIGSLASKVTEITSGRRSQRQNVDGQIEMNGERFQLPADSLAKTMETSVFSRKMDSTDELELMGKSSHSMVEDGYHHKYVRDW
ncbi:uncharacterized protein LTR77_004602 [Saxophila tyrrhenica]|uniref:Rhodopsin domain-containing protein n=1 Tax=Saxophila tyrrhenica TaxID=1690608 RepID=A0AAV9PG57_9PEZI|nr:hypothetical protein LTR77_004602 [Saxophila tyrrhenica]